jgi:hypothetical protein
LSFLLWIPLHSSRAASVAILPSALFVSDIRSVHGGCSRFSRCCYLISVLSSHLFAGSRAPGVSRSHLNSAVELGCFGSKLSRLGHCPHCFLAIAQWFVYLSAHPQPM